jgi:hypothetical protein
LMDIYYNRCNVIDQASKSFKNKFAHLYKMGLTPPWTKYQRLYGLEIYSKDSLVQRNNLEKFNDMTKALNGHKEIASWI